MPGKIKYLFCIIQFKIDSLLTVFLMNLAGLQYYTIGLHPRIIGAVAPPRFQEFFLLSINHRNNNLNRQHPINIIEPCPLKESDVYVLKY